MSVSLDSAMVDLSGSAIPKFLNLFEPVEADSFYLI